MSVKLIIEHSESLDNIFTIHDFKGYVPRKGEELEVCKEHTYVVMEVYHTLYEPYEITLWVLRLDEVITNNKRKKQ